MQMEFTAEEIRTLRIAVETELHVKRNIQRDLESRGRKMERSEAEAFNYVKRELARLNSLLARLKTAEG